MDKLKLDKWEASLFYDQNLKLKTKLENDYFEFKFPSLDDLRFELNGNYIVVEFTIKGKPRKIRFNDYDSFNDKLSQIYKKAFGLTTLVEWEVLYPYEGRIKVLGREFLITLRDHEESESFWLVREGMEDKLMHSGKYTKMIIRLTDIKGDSDNTKEDFYSYAYFESEKEALLELEKLLSKTVSKI